MMRTRHSSNVGIVDELGEDRVFREVPELWSSYVSSIQVAYKQIGDQRCANCPRTAGPVRSTEVGLSKSKKKGVQLSEH